MILEPFHNKKASEAKEGHPWSVLLVDDDVDQQLTFKNYLTKEGMNVTLASSVSEAMELLDRSSFDVIVSDLRMPELNGFDFIHMLRDEISSSDKKYIPIIILTAEGTHFEADTLKIGADMYCEKRLGEKLLASQIRCLLGNNAMTTVHNISERRKNL